MTLPYSKASAGENALRELQRVIENAGGDEFGYMKSQAKKSLTVQFLYRGQRFHYCVSMTGYAGLWLTENPYSQRMKHTKLDHEKKALKQAEISVCSILRDQIKATIVSVEAGVMSLESAMLGAVMLENGQTVAQLASEKKMLPQPKGN